MGYRISWIAFKGLDRQTLLERTQLTETGQSDEANEEEFSLALLPTGWTVLFRNANGYATDERLAALSQGVTVVGVEINENTMCNRVACHEDGRLLWSVDYDCEKGRYNLDTTGRLPPVYEDIRTRLFAEQEADGGEESDTDYIFDVPVELAEHLTGYRHDGIIFEEGQPGFMALVSTAPAEPKWWQKLLGKRA